MVRRLEAGCAAPFLHIRSAILKISQPRTVKPTPQKSMTDTIAFPFCFLQDAYALSRSTASNKLLKQNRRGRPDPASLAFRDRRSYAAPATSSSARTTARQRADRAGRCRPEPRPQAAASPFVVLGATMPRRDSCGSRALLSPLARDARPCGETRLARCPAPSSRAWGPLLVILCG